MRKTTINQSTYFNERVVHPLSKRFKIPKDVAEKLANQHGFYLGEHGAIKNRVRGFDGLDITFIPQGSKDAATDKEIKAKLRNYKRIASNQSPTVLHEDHFTEHLEIKRSTPEQVKNGAARYYFPSKKYTGLQVLPMPNNLAIERYNSGLTGGVGFSTEGYFKAFEMGLNGLETVAFTSITTYKLCDSLKDYLLKRKLDTFVLTYDGDKLDIKTDKNEYRKTWNGKTTNNKNPNFGLYTSKRLESFYNSAANFAKAFFKFCKDNDLQINLHWCAINSKNQHKGIDDLFQAVEDKEGLANELLSLRTSDNFTFEKLHKTTHETRLQKHFKLASHKAFYHKYKGLIENQDFGFKGHRYTVQTVYNDYSLFTKSKTTPVFTLANDPHQIDIEQHQIDIDKYLSDKENEISVFIEDNNKIAVDSQTGSAKTTFFSGCKTSNGKNIKGYFEKNNVRGVITAPYVSLAKQLYEGATSKSVTLLHGKVSQEQKNKALNSQLVICTYDTLHHVTDLDRRLLVIDESHNLINHYGRIKAVRGKKARKFRAKVLRRLVAKFEDASKKTILLSGTMSKMLCKALGFTYLKVNSKYKQKVNIKAVEAHNTTPEALNLALCKQLSQTNFESDNIHFALYDNKDQLEAVKSILIEEGILKANDIEIITQDSITENEDVEAYNQIIKDGTVKGKKLIMCTCLLAEGISIKNKNIGTVFCVGVRCTDKFRQFVARFRSVDEVNVTSILEAEKNLPKTFGKFTASFLLEMEIDKALLQLKHYKQSSTYELNQYDNEDLRYNDEMDLDNSDYSEFFDLLSFDGKPNVDILKVVASVREKINDESNNAYFYTQLLELENFHVTGSSLLDNETNHEELINCVATTSDKLKAARKSAKEILVNTLLENPSTPVTAYYIHLKGEKKGKENRHGLKFVNTTGKEFVNESDLQARQFYEEYKTYFSKSYYIATIRAFLKLNFIGAEKSVIDESIEDLEESEFSKNWKAFERVMSELLYKKKRHRDQMKHPKKTDAKISIEIKKRVGKFATENNNTITTNEAQPIINKLFKERNFKGFKKDRYNQTNYDLKDSYSYYADKKKINYFIETMFNVVLLEDTNEGKKYKIKNVYEVAKNWEKSTAESVPFSYIQPPKIVGKPLEMLKL